MFKRNRYRHIYPIWIFMVVLLLLSACATLSPAHFERPKISLVHLDLKKSTFLEQNILLTFRVQNPNNADLPVTKFNFTLELNGEKFAEGVSQESFTVPALGDKKIGVNVTTSVLKNLAQLTIFMDGGGGPLAFKVAGMIYVDLPFIPPFHFNKEGVIPLGGGHE
ncbi:MAG: LEA type 2 family protein [Magnetococcus sp. DMHC-6]